MNNQFIEIDDIEDSELSLDNTDERFDRPFEPEISPEEAEQDPADRLSRYVLENPIISDSIVENLDNKTKTRMRRLYKNLRFHPKWDLNVKESVAMIMNAPHEIQFAHSLDLSGLSSTKLRELAAVKTLQLFNQAESKKFERRKAIPVIGTVHKLSLANTTIKYVYGLKHVKDINLTGCVSLNDVSPLKNAYKVNLTSCFYIENISTLGNVHDLNLTDTNVTDQDLVGLSNVDTLTLQYCGGITDVSALRNVRKLDLRGCDNLIKLDGLENVKILDISECDEITSLEPLKSVEELYMILCTRINDLSPVKNVKILYVDGCEDITDVSMLKNVKTLSVPQTGVKKITNLPNVDYIDAENCYELTIISNLPILEGLDAQNCPNLRTVTNLPNLKSIGLTDTYDIETLDIDPGRVEIIE
jgi:hypothetical protein